LDTRKAAAAEMVHDPWHNLTSAVSLFPVSLRAASRFLRGEGREAGFGGWSIPARLRSQSRDQGGLLSETLICPRINLTRGMSEPIPIATKEPTERKEKEGFL
jgi:hypothetical protein